MTYLYRFSVALFFFSVFFASVTSAEDGHNLWLRYAPLPVETAKVISEKVNNVFCVGNTGDSHTLAQHELVEGLSGLFSRPVPCSNTIENGSVVLAHAGMLQALDQFDLPWSEIGEEGFIIRGLELYGKNIILITSNSETGLLYGTFTFLRHLQTRPDMSNMDIVSVPGIKLRLLNHWDNPDRTVERGYAGESIWDWQRLPDDTDPRYTEYARANASIGINGTVLNNVNASALILTDSYLEKVTAIAAVLRPWGLRVYLSARFSAPQEIGGLTTSDPGNTAVQAWWKNTAARIYSRIPDFGGFLVKANSEGQPGPQDYGRTHADGANMLAAALAPYGGVVMWRAFVYSDTNPEDRARQAYSEFNSLDGEFAGNVLVQVKNGPVDFQPREPFHPLFGAMQQTPMMMELQITKEYLGFASHLVYLGPLYEEVLKADTYRHGKGSLVANVITGRLNNQDLTGIAGVSGIGMDRDWMGSDFNQANWYVFGRLAWDPMGSSEGIARDWLAQTFSYDPGFIDKAAAIMMQSREAAVNYMTPLGLAHLMGTGHHYGPAPWVKELSRPEWNPVYYHRADRYGIGFDRTPNGSDALSQYSQAVAAGFSDPATMDEKYLLWFHHLPWDFSMQSGLSLWEELVSHYDTGVATVADMLARWNELTPFVDEARFNKTKNFLQIQLDEARWWRDACLAYFMSVSGLSLPGHSVEPAHPLEYYQSLSFPDVPR